MFVSRLNRLFHSRRKFVSNFLSYEQQGSLRFTSQLSEKEKVDLFFDSRVQNLLKQLTGLDLEKVFRVKRDGKKREPAEYRFMTTKELKEALDSAVKRAEKKLAMPPIMLPCEDNPKVLVKDDKLQGYSESSFVFTDITFGTNDRSRTIVVREKDGTLREARLDERNRLNELYFSRQGRKMTPPSVFKEENMKKVLEKGEYEFLLDLACAQFEPDDPEYVRITEAVYSAVDEAGASAELHSTRHYGPFAFHLALRANLHNLLTNYLSTFRLENACWLIELFHILHPESQSACLEPKPSDPIKFVQAYIDLTAKEKDQLTLLLKNYKEMLATKKVKEEETLAVSN